MWSELIELDLVGPGFPRPPLQQATNKRGRNLDARSNRRKFHWELFLAIEEEGLDRKGFLSFFDLDSVYKDCQEKEKVKETNFQKYGKLCPPLAYLRKQFIVTFLKPHWVRKGSAMNSESEISPFPKKARPKQAIITIFKREKKGRGERQKRILLKKGKQAHQA